MTLSHSSFGAAVRMNRARVLKSQAAGVVWFAVDTINHNGGWSFHYAKGTQYERHG